MQAPDEQIEGLHCGVNGNVFIVFVIIIANKYIFCNRFVFYM